MTNKSYDLLIIEISARIKQTRKAKKLTVQELAYRCDMERSNMSRIEAGRTNVTIKTLSLIATALSVKLRDLIPE
ncbi:MAG: helix-turn-helix transcriptional regulator [Rikenellaceae bacterium]